MGRPTGTIEMKEPVLFMRPTSSYLASGGTIEIPHPLESLHHEVELAVIISQKARDVSVAAAMDYVGGKRSTMECGKRPRHLHTDKCSCFSEGVGSVRVRDKVNANIIGLIDVHFDVQRREELEVRMFASVDDMFCIFQGALGNVPLLKQLF